MNKRELEERRVKIFKKVWLISTLMLILGYLIMFYLLWGG